MKKIAIILIYLIPIAILSWLLFLDIRPAGILESAIKPGDISPFIETPLPSSRVDMTDEFFSIHGDPVYFAVHKPQTEFETVEVEVKFAIENQPIFEIGPQMDIFTGAADLKPLYFEGLGEGMFAIKVRGKTLFTDNQYESIDDFLAENPDRNDIGLYKADLNNSYRDEQYRSLSGIKTYETDLRGSYKIATYIKNEDLDFRFVLTDMNRTIGVDDITARLFDENAQLLDEFFIADDENDRQDQKMSRHDLHIQKSHLPEGVYYIELIVTSDIFTRQIETAQRYMSFVNGFTVGDTVGYRDGAKPARLYTNSHIFTFETLHSEALQTISVDGDTVDIDATHEKIHHISTSNDIKRVDIPLGDMKVTVNGKVSFDRDSFFEPDPVKLDAYTNWKNLAGIITSYEIPKSNGNYFVASQKFDLDTIPSDGEAIRFVISAPFIESFDGRVDIRRITVRFEKDKLQFVDFWREVLHRLPFGL